MKAGDAEVCFDTCVEAASLDYHSRLVGCRYVGRARGEDSNPAIDRLGTESLPQHARRSRVLDNLHARGGGRCIQGFDMRLGHAADQALTLAFGEGHRQPGRLSRCLAGGEHHLWNAAPQEAPEVEPRAPAKLFELQTAQLGQGLVFAELTCEQAAQDIPHRPASTSRIRCQ